MNSPGVQKLPGARVRCVDRELRRHQHCVRLRQRDLVGDALPVEDVALEVRAMTVKEDHDDAGLADVKALRDVQQHARIAIAIVVERGGPALARIGAAVERKRRVLEFDEIGLRLQGHRRGIRTARSLGLRLLRLLRLRWKQRLRVCAGSDRRHVRQRGCGGRKQAPPTRLTTNWSVAACPSACPSLWAKLRDASYRQAGPPTLPKYESDHDEQSVNAEHGRIVVIRTLKLVPP